MAAGYGVNGSGVTGPSGVTGHDTLVTVEMVAGEGSPQEAEQGREGMEPKIRSPWLWLSFWQGLYDLSWGTLVLWVYFPA